MDNEEKVETIEEGADAPFVSDDESGDLELPFIDSVISESLEIY